MSRPIVIQRQHNQSNLLFSYFCPNFLFFFSFLLCLDLLAATTTVVMDLVPSPGQMPIGREKDALIGADSAPDCRQN
jgi:hypothetical protein